MVNKNIQDSVNQQNTSNKQVSNSIGGGGGGVQQVFTFVQDANSKELPRNDIFRLDNANNNEKSASVISSSDNVSAGNNENPANKERNLTYSPLGRIMNKIGLKFGDHTGHNLNKLIMSKP